MKVNRFGMSQKIFAIMTKSWAAQQLNHAELLWREQEFQQCGKVVVELKELLMKTFLQPDEDITILLRDCNSIQFNLNRERSVPVEDAVLSS